MHGILLIHHFSAFAGENCAAETTTSIEAAVSEVAAAFQAQDRPGMKQAHEDSVAKLSCLEEPISTEVAAQIHQMLALSAFTEGERARVEAELRASRQLTAGAALLEQAVVDGHPLRMLHARAGAAPADGEAVVDPSGARITVDGQDGGLRVPGASVVVQRYARAAVHETILLAPDEKLPAAADVPVEVPWRRAALLSATGAAALGATVMYARSWQSHQTFWDTGAGALPDSALDAQYDKTNAQAGTAVGLAGGAVLFGAVAVLTW